MKLFHAFKRELPLLKYSWAVWAVEPLFFMLMLQIINKHLHPRVEITWENGILQPGEQIGENLEFKPWVSAAWSVSEDSNSSLIPCAS